MAENCYVVLGVDPDASTEEIRAAFRGLAKKYHPDHHGGDGEMFRRIRHAYSVLNDPRSRRSHDRSLRPPPPPPRRRGGLFRDVTDEKIGRRPVVEPPGPDRGRSPGAFSEDLFRDFDRSFHEIFEWFWRM